MGEEGINSRLDTLFGEWEAAVQWIDAERGHAHCVFSRDGVVNEQFWSMAPTGVVFLLKERNLVSRYTQGLPDTFRKDLRLHANAEPWREIGQWTYGILNCHSRPPYEEADQHYERACRSAALVNLKKMAGGSTSSLKEIWEHAIRDKEYLNRQLAIIDPDVIVCCGKHSLFQLAKEVFDDAGAATCVFRPSSGASPVSGACYRGRSFIWIDYVHPSMRRVSWKTKYDHLLDIVAGCVESLVPLRRRVQ